MVGIYKITNKINHKVYIGQSVDIKRRWYEHKTRAFDPNNNCYDKPLYRSFRKHGLDNFIFEVVQECSVEEMNILETKYIHQFNSLVPNGYNLMESSSKNSASVVPVCKECGKIISRDTKNQLCRECYVKSTRKTERPSREELKKLIRNLPFTRIGVMFNVADNSIRKWCDEYKLPRTKKEIKQYSDKEWSEI